MLLNQNLNHQLKAMALQNPRLIPCLESSKHYLSFHMPPKVERLSTQGKTNLFSVEQKKKGTVDIHAHHSSWLLGAEDSEFLTKQKSGNSVLEGLAQ